MVDELKFVFRPKRVPHDRIETALKEIEALMGGVHEGTRIYRPNREDMRAGRKVLGCVRETMAQNNEEI
jgi:hypothetical protein